MTKTATNLILMLITIVAGTYFYITLCSECGNLQKEEAAPTSVIATEKPEQTNYPFQLNKGDFSLNSNDNYNFSSSSSSILTPLSASLEDALSSLKNYLNDNANSVVNVTGFYKSDEDNTSAFPNLGLARANAIKNDLASKGFNTAQINTMGSLMDDMVAKEGIYMGAASFVLEEKSESADEQLNILYEKIKAEPLILYFNTAQASISLNEEQRQKVADITKYLDKKEGAMVQIVGHTDNTGKATTNIKLGMDRAVFAKNYLMQNGIGEDKITLSSKGQTQPLESNATEEGRDKNRRTVITLQ